MQKFTRFYHFRTSKNWNYCPHEFPKGNIWSKYLWSKQKLSSILNLNHHMNPPLHSKNFNFSLVNIMTRDSIGILTCFPNVGINLWKYLKNQRRILIQLWRFQERKEAFLNQPITVHIWYFCLWNILESYWKREKALLPSAQLISVLLEPGERAYSWYQHQKAHTIETAMQHSFYEVITSEPGTPEYSLRQVSWMRLSL